MRRLAAAALTAFHGASAPRRLRRSVGPAAANLRLSRRRGEAVRAALVARGFSAARIAVDAYGEDRPPVETPDGVSERQNRHVMIEFFRAEASPALPPR